MRNRFLAIGLLFPAMLRAQSEKVSVHFDKSLCYPDDKIWWAADIYGGRQTPSTTVYMELYRLYKDSVGHLTQRKFPSVKDSSHTCMGISYSNFHAPDTAGSYMASVYTANSLAKYYPFTVRGGDSLLLIKNLKKDSSIQELPSDSVDFGTFSEGQYKGLYYLQVKNADHFSVAVVSKEQPEHMNRAQEIPAENYEVDTSGYLTFRGTLVRDPHQSGPLETEIPFILEGKAKTSMPGEKGKKKKIDIIKNKKNGNILNISDMKTVPVDTNRRITLGAYFYRSSFFYYQSKAVLKLDETTRSFVQPDYKIETFHQLESDIPEIYRGKSLQTVIVKKTKPYQDRNDWLFERYAQDIPSAGLPTTSYNLMDGSLTEDMQGPEGLKDYVDQNCLHCKTGPHQWYWFIDNEQDPLPLPWLMPKIIGQDIHNLAFLQVVDNYDNGVNIYEMHLFNRKGEDLRGVGGKMKVAGIQGYDSLAKWNNKPDRTTQIWMPYVDGTLGPIFKAKPPFNIEIMGMDKNDKPFYYKKAIPGPKPPTP